MRFGRADAVVSGTVIDDATGLTLASATVQIDGTYTGTITNADGRFELRVASLPVRLVVRFIGYATTTLVVTTETPVSIRLDPSPVTLPEIVVTDEDPAVGILRRVIERKKEWRADLVRFRADAYTRLVIENDTGIVSMTESLSDYWWDRDLGRREVLRGWRRSANLPADSPIPAALTVENLYDDDVELAGATLMGITHPDALSVYEVRLLGTRSYDGRVVFDIAVRPRNRLASAFEGRISVLDEEFALLEVSLRPGESFLFPPPIQFFDIELQQQFASFGGPFVLPVDFRASYDVKVGIGGILEFPTIRARQVSRLDGYEVNGAAADSVFAVDDPFVTDRTSLRGDSLVASGTLVPLSEREAVALATIDSTATFDRTFRPTGALARFARLRVEGSGDAVRDRRLALRWAPEAWVDRVSGLHAELGSTLRWDGRIAVGGSLGYDTAPRMVEWSARTEWVASFHPVPPGSDRQRRNRSLRPALVLSASFDHGLAQRFSSRIQTPVFNSVRVLLNGDDFFDYLRRDRWEIGIERRALRPGGLEIEAGVRRDHDRSIAAGSPFRIVGTAAQRPNPAIAEGTVTSAFGRVRLGTRPDDLAIGGSNAAELGFEIAPRGGLGSKASFARATTRVDVRLPTFYRRRLLPNVLDVAVMASRAFGSLPPQWWSIVDGTGIWASFGGLRSLDEPFYEGDSHVIVAWEHQFRTVPFELLGLRGLARRGYSLILTGAHGRTWLSDGSRSKARHVPGLSDGWHHEAGVSVSGLFKLFRVNITRRLDRNEWRVGIGAARIF